MIFRVKYLDKHSLQKDIDRYNYAKKNANPCKSQINRHPLDNSWNHHFGISKDIESSDYSIIYYEECKDKRFTYESVLIQTQLVIEVHDELLYVNLFHMKYSRHFKEDRSILENFDSILKEPKLYNDYFYSWGSMIDRIHILDLEKDWKEWLDRDNVFNRDKKIDKLLSGSVDSKG